MKTKLFITGIALVALTAMVSAQTTGTASRSQNGKGKGVAWVDANNDGICDNYNSLASAGKMEKGNANCNGTAKRLGNGQGNGQRKGMAAMRGNNGTGRGQNKGVNFVDADKNGVCDNRQAPSAK